MRKPNWEKRDLWVKVLRGDVISPRIEGMWRYKTNSRNAKMPGIGSHPSRFVCVQYFVKEMASDGGEFTTARLNSWLIDNNPWYAMGPKEAAGYLRSMKCKLGIEVCYEDRRGSRAMRVWKVKENDGSPDRMGR